MLTSCNSIICNRVTKKYIFTMLKTTNKSILNVLPVRIKAPIWRPALFPLIVLLIAFCISPPAASSSLNLSVPEFMDVSDHDTFEMIFACNEDVGGLSAGLQIPDGLYYAGNARMEMAGCQRSIEPTIVAGGLRCDLTDALKSFRHIVINEWEANPPGSDTKMEWIEIFNPTAARVDISNWMLRDSYYHKTVSISSNTILAPGGYQTINWTNGSLVNSYPSSVTLIDGTGKEVDRTSETKDEKNNDLCWARLPSGKDLDRDSDWMFQKGTPGSSNGGWSCDIYAGEALRLQFNISAGCGAPDSARLDAEMATESGSFSSQPQVMNIKRANLSLSVQPDRFDVAKGDTVTWTIILENRGIGTAYDVILNSSLSAGLQFMETNSMVDSRMISSIAPGGIDEIKLRARAMATKSSYPCNFSLAWGSGPCQKSEETSILSPRTAIAKEPDQPRSLTIGQSASFTIFADLPRGASDLWINDTIPVGLVYDQSSFSWQGLEPRQEKIIDNPDGTRQVGWFFGQVGSARQIEIGYDCLLANLAGNQNDSILTGTNATMTWLESGACKRDADAAGPITIAEPDLELEIQPAHAFAAPGRSISFWLNVSNTAYSEASAYDLEIQALLPPGLVYEPGSAELLAGPPASFDESHLRWNIDSLDWTAGERAAIRFKAICQGRPGDVLTASARLTWTSRPGESQMERTGSGDAGINDYLRDSQAVVDVMNLAINKTADPDPAPVGETLIYTLTYQNLGDSRANNVNITDELDPGVTFISADPAPSWNSSRSLSWTLSHLDPGDIQSIAIQVLVDDALPDGARLKNCFAICSDELERISPICIYTPVLNETRLEVSKKPLQKAVRRGEEVDYVITVCNRGGQPATNITVRDVFDMPVELLSAWPEMADDGAWHFSSLSPGECLEMGIKIRVPRIDVNYQSSQSVSGSGFMRSFRDYSTSRPAEPLVNRVHVSSDQMQLSASASVQILAEQGTELSLREHGSGKYDCREELEFLTANKSIRLDRSLRAEVHPANGSLFGSVAGSVSSLWHGDVRAKNGITNTTFRESYRYSSAVADESHFDLDQNRSLMNTNCSLEGLAHLGMLKLPAGGNGMGKASISEEDYAGAVRISERISDLGQGVEIEKSSSGRGYVARDATIGPQRSYEWGSGMFQSDEMMESISGSSSKELEASFQEMSLPVSGRTALNISQKWSEGMISRTDSSLISEEYSHADRLKMKTVSPGPRERKSEASFYGRSRMQAAYLGRSGGDRSLELAAEEVLMGDYTIERKIALSGAARYDHPHLYLRKDGWRVEDRDEDVARYTITICNDGNAALGPIFLQDIFPQGARFINSTLQPNRIDGNGSNWTILHLAIGDTLNIGINLDVGSCSGDIVNRAAAIGSYSGGSVAARNISLLDANPLGSWPGPGTERQGGIACPGSNIGCACLAEEAANESDFLDPRLIETPIDCREGENGSCALSTRALEEEKASGRC